MTVTISAVSHVDIPYYTVRFAHCTTQLRGFQKQMNGPSHGPHYTVKHNADVLQYRISHSNPRSRILSALYLATCDLQIGYI